MDNKIDEILAMKKHCIEDDCNYLSLSDQYEEIDIDLSVRVIINPKNSSCNTPFIKTDSMSFVYSFDNKQINFENETFISCTEEIDDVVILDEDKRYVFMLLNTGRVVVAEHGNLENKINFCKDVKQIVKSDESLFLLVSKENYFYVNEVVFINNRFTHKIVSDRLKETDAKLFGSDGKFYLHARNKFYNKNCRPNADLVGDYIHEWNGFVIVGIKKEKEYILTVFEDCFNLSNIKIFLKKFDYKIKSFENYIIFYTDKVFSIFRIVNGVIEFYKEFIAQFDIYTFDVFIYNKTLQLTILTNEETYKASDEITDLSDRTNFKTREIIMNTSNLGFYNEILEKKQKDSLNNDLVDCNDEKESKEETILDKTEKLNECKSDTKIITEDSSKTDKEATDNYSKKIIGKIIKENKNKERKKGTDKCVAVFKKQNQSKDRFQAYINEQEVQKAAETSLEASEFKHKHILDDFERRIGDKIDTAITNAMIRTDFYKKMVLDVFAPKLEACINEIRIQAISEIKQMKTALLSLSNDSFNEFNKKLQINTAEAVNYFCTTGLDGLQEILVGLNRNVDLLNSFNDDEQIILLNTATNNNKNVDIKTYGMFCELILSNIHIDNISKSSLSLFSSILKHLESSDKKYKENYPETFYLIKYFKKRVRKRLENK